MASSFAAQLRTIAQNSTHELDLRARRVAHAESLLFSREVAAKQSFESLFAICAEGFQELCSLDPAFVEFERNLFSAQSVRTEREQLNKSENETLDNILERCMTMLGGKAMLKPAVRCLEWLVRRFRVHAYNSTALLLSVLPWHEMSIWRNVLSIIPKDKCIDEWKFLGMYKEGALNIPRTAVVYTATHNDGFFTLLNNHVIKAASDGIAYSTLLRFWSGITSEAVLGRINAAQSGRKEIHRQRMQDLLLKTLPILSDGLEIQGYPELTTACFTLAMVLVSKADLDDRVVDSLLLAVAVTVQYPETDMKAAIVTSAVLVDEKQTRLVPKAVLDVFMKLSNLDTTLLDLSSVHSLGALVETLVNTAISTTKRKHVQARLAFTERLLRLSNASSGGQLISVAAKTVLAKLITPDDANGMETTLRDGLIELLQRLNEEQKFSLLISDASRLLHQDTAQLEALLGSTVAVPQASLATSIQSMAIDAPAKADESLDDILKRLPSRTVDTTSFLGHHDQHLFEQLVECFRMCNKSSSDMQRFVRLPIWSSASEAPLLESFLLRVAVGSFSGTQKTSALRLLAYQVQERGDVNAQLLLNYILTALSDPTRSVRHAATELLIAVEKAIQQGDGSEPSPLPQLYTRSQQELIVAIGANHLEKILNQVFLPTLEECVIDAARVRSITKAAICGPIEANPATSKDSQVDLKKSLRQDLLSLLSSNAVASPLLQVKISTIKLLQDVNKVGANTKSRALAPILRSWSALDQNGATEVAAAEGLSLSEIDKVMMQVISGQDKDAAGLVFEMLEDQNTEMRNELISMGFERLQQIWHEMKHETRNSAAQRLFDLAFSDKSVLARGAQGVLRSVNLGAQILGSLLELSAGKIVSVQGEEQPKKRRRTSHGTDSLPPDLARMMSAATSRLALVLEILDSANPETKPELMPVLFDVLSLLKRLGKQHLYSPYLMNLCLGSILAIVQKQGQLARPVVDVSSIRVDLVTDCVRSSDNPQVQNTAVLLSASLASLVPDRVLHNIMPIFTFVGQNMISKEDEHSIYVVNQAIDQIIPALVGSLRKQSKDLIKSTSSLLASFTAAFDHIPPYRRVSIYSRLLDRMGTEDFAFAIFAMLAYKKGHHPAFVTFCGELLTEIGAEVHLVTLRKLVELLRDLLSSQPRISEELFGISENASQNEKHLVSQAILKGSLLILRSKLLHTLFKRLHKLDTQVADQLRNHFDICLRQLLLMVRECKGNHDAIAKEGKQCLDALLTLLSMKELFTIMPQVLTNIATDNDLKPQTLRVLASQIQRNPTKDSQTRTAAIDLLRQLTVMLHEETEVSSKQALVICIDRLSEIYGKKDIETVVAAATVIASDHCLNSSNQQLGTMSLLCLASMLEVMKEACVPIVPRLLLTLTRILRGTLQDEVEAEEIHNAALALVAAIASHVSFLISDDHLQTLLVLCCYSSDKYNSSAASDARTEALSLLARNVDLQSLSAALLGETLSVSIASPRNAEMQILDMVSTALKSATKATVSKSADDISQVLLAHLDQRARILDAADVADEGTEEAIDAVESSVNNISIEFIYKLNDTTFRPIFESWIDWATNATDKMESDDIVTTRTLRQTSLFILLTTFFETLKSIVTSYASYIISPAHTILTTFASSKRPKSPTELRLYISLFAMLRSTFTHDIDGFFTTPSHFEPLAAPLVNQLTLSSHKSLHPLIYSAVIPTIIALATATLDTPAHHQALSHHLVQLRHSSSAAVRLASIKTLAAIISDEAVGDEFIANVIGIGSGEGEGARGVGGGGSVGEVMIYVNEMLEDDDEDVEREVRKWVQSVRERTGEDVFEV